MEIGGKDNLVTAARVHNLLRYVNVPSTYIGDQLKILSYVPTDSSGSLVASCLDFRIKQAEKAWTGRL